MSSASQNDLKTQPLSQTVYDDFTNASKSFRPSKHLGFSSDTQPSTPFTFGQDNSAFIDILDGLPDGPDLEQEDESQADDEDELAEASQLAVRAEIYPEAQRFLQPQTPATHGKKRNARGEVLDRTLSTPRLPANPFANYDRCDVGVMGLSQAFGATQAASSPTTLILQSDGVSDRPSPNMYNIQRPLTAHALSSPARLPHTGLQRSVTEPHATYISMKVSQEQRDRRLKMQATSSPINSKRVLEISDDDFESPSNHIPVTTRRRRVDFTSRAAIRGSARNERPTLRPQSVRRGVEASPIQQRHKRLALSESDELAMGGIDNVTDEETEHEEDRERPRAERRDDSGEEEDKENVAARHVQVPMTVSKPTRRVYEARATPSSPIRLKLLLSPSSVEEVDKIDELAVDDPNHSSPRSIKKPHQRSDPLQTVAIADSQLSQPSGHGGREHTARGLVPSSSIEPHNIVPQSQIWKEPATSQLDSSIARRLDTSASQQTASPPISSKNHSSPSHRQQSSPIHRRSPRNPRLRFEDFDAGNHSAIPIDINSSPPTLARKVQSLARSQEAEITELKSRPEEEADKADLSKSPGVLEVGLESDAAQETPLNRKSTLGSTIPETNSTTRHGTVIPASMCSNASDLVRESSQHEPKSSSDVVRLQPPSKSSTLFYTAPSHPSDSPASQQIRQLRHSPLPAKSPSQSPNVSRSIRIRAFADIVNPSPLDNNEDIDLDVDILTTEDLNFHAELNAMNGSSPINRGRKRRQRNNGIALGVTRPEQDKPLQSSAGSSQQSDELQRAAPQTHERHDVALNEKENEPIRHSTNQVMSIQAVDLKSKTAEVGKPRGKITQKLRPKSATEITDEQTPVLNGTEMSNLEVVISTPPPSKQTNKVKDSIMTDVSSEEIIAANRVFAYFNGTPQGHYPATCLNATGVGDPRYTVLFEDGTMDTIGHHGIKRLELRRGDIVKVDREGLRTYNYIVLDLLDKHSSSVAGPETPSRRGRPPKLGANPPETDIFGHTNVLIVLQQRKSGPEIEVKEMIVPLGQIYITIGNWSKLKDRAYSHKPPKTSPTSGLHTPMDRPSLPNTPTSRNRRGKSSTKPPFTNSAPSTSKRQTSTLFSNLVFSLTNISDTQRPKIEQQIRAAGGHLLETGFHELFTNPTSKPSPTKNPMPHIPQPFALKPSAATRGFTALISDDHSRTRNFLQALALGIPCLATRWITDCISASALLPWGPYLLASGYSDYLTPPGARKKTVHSRLLPPSDPACTSLQSLISARPNFLLGAAVLLIVGKGKGKGDEMTAYPFIAYALGARKVVMVPGWQAAKDLLSESESEIEIETGGEGSGAGEAGWDWLAVHERLGVDVPEAEKLLFGAKAKRGLGRERAGMRPRVVVMEFVVQSLIAGGLMSG